MSDDLNESFALLAPTPLKSFSGLPLRESTPTNPATTTNAANTTTTISNSSNSSNKNIPIMTPSNILLLDQSTTSTGSSSLRKNPSPFVSQLDQFRNRTPILTPNLIKTPSYQIVKTPINLRNSSITPRPLNIRERSSSILSISSNSDSPCSFTFLQLNLTQQFIDLLLNTYQDLLINPTITPFEPTNPPPNILSIVTKKSLKLAKIKKINTGLNNISNLNLNNLIFSINHLLLIEIRNDGYFSRTNSSCSISSINEMFPNLINNNNNQNSTSTPFKLINNATNLLPSPDSITLSKPMIQENVKPRNIVNDIISLDNC